MQRAVAPHKQVVPAHETRHKRRAGVVINIGRCGVLLNAPVTQDDDTVRQAQRLFLVMRHVQHGDAQFSLHAAQLGAHFHTQARVQVAQRLVQQQQTWANDDGARHRHTLLLPARELRGQALVQTRQTDRGQGLFDALRDLGRRDFAQTQTKGHVFEH